MCVLDIVFEVDCRKNVRLRKVPSSSEVLCLLAGRGGHRPGLA